MLSSGHFALGYSSLPLHLIFHGDSPSYSPGSSLFGPHSFPLYTPNETSLGLDRAPWKQTEMESCMQSGYKGALQGAGEEREEGRLST